MPNPSRPTLKVTRLAVNTYAVVTDTVLSDGSLRADANMVLDGEVLRSHEERGTIRIGGLMTVKLGPRSLAAVSALQIGETVEVR